MTIRHFALLRFALLGAVATFTLSPLFLFGQAPSPSPNGEKKTEEKGVVHIPSGRLRDVLMFLNERFPAGKFTATPDVLSLQVEAIQVSGANGSGPSLNDVAHAVERACDPLAVSEPTDPNHPVFNFSKNLILAPGYNAVDAVEAFNLEDTVAADSDDDKFQGARYRQAELIQHMANGTIESIREEGRVPINAEPRFQFNPTANVLIATGSADVLGITRKIVDAVNASAHSSMTAKAHSQPTPTKKPDAAAPAPSPGH